MNKLSFRNEFKRKLVHFASSIIGISIILFDRETVLPLLLIFSIVFPFLDYLRIKNEAVSDFYYTYFNTITRPFESSQLTGASFVFLGSLLTYILFDQQIAGISLIIMSLSDAMAAIIGVGIGKTKLLNKTLEGTFAFFMTTYIILYLFNIPLLIGLLVAFVGSLAELIEIPKVNDNISIPIVVGFMLTIAGV